MSFIENFTISLYIRGQKCYSTILFPIQGQFLSQQNEPTHVILSQISLIYCPFWWCKFEGANLKVKMYFLYQINEHLTYIIIFSLKYDRKLSSTRIFAINDNLDGSKFFMTMISHLCVYSVFWNVHIKPTLSRTGWYVKNSFLLN